MRPTGLSALLLVSLLSLRSPFVYGEHFRDGLSRDAFIADAGELVGSPSFLGLSGLHWSDVLNCLSLGSVFILGVAGWLKGRRWLAPLFIAIPSIGVFDFVDPADTAGEGLIGAVSMVVVFYVVAGIGLGIHRMVQAVIRRRRK